MFNLETHDELKDFLKNWVERESYKPVNAPYTLVLYGALTSTCRIIFKVYDQCSRYAVFGGCCTPL